MKVFELRRTYTLGKNTFYCQGKSVEISINPIVWKTSSYIGYLCFFTMQMGEKCRAREVAVAWHLFMNPIKR